MRLILAALFISLPAPASTAGTLTFEAPKDWVSKTPASSMRVAEFTLPRAAGDAEDGSVTVFFFGSSQGGNVQANIDRWIGQMSQPGGRPSSEVAKTTTSKSRSGLELTIVDVSGTYVAEMSPGSAEHFNKPGFRQLAVYVATPGGPYFVKALGPNATIAKWHASVESFLASLAYK
ncbi:MAG TPA: hypothetical protein VFV78_03930 [Vicinamibacterales bacterium]|nr:hypothetical protein [Vicinamibacterales bacterium]